MRHRDPHDDPPERRRRRYQGPPVTLGHIRSHGVRHLLIYCSEGLYCDHSAIVDADRWPDDTVLLDLDAKAVCTKCGMIGADLRPNWSERPPPGGLTPGAVAGLVKPTRQHPEMSGVGIKTWPLRWKV